MPPWILSFLRTQQLAMDFYSFCFAVVILLYFVFGKKWNSNRLLPLNEQEQDENEQ